jgi:2-polyprenyl-3-methyl-5-hydroxy-6-metoxy-1,4-benzoquinol methylase
MLVDEKKINPNISELYKYFKEKTAKYFDEKGAPKDEYFEDVACYNCGSKEYSSQFRANNFRHIRCAVCGMIYVNPRFKETIAHNLYDEADYTEYYKIKLIPSIDYRRNVLAENKYGQLIKYFNEPGSVLDIGCGLGEVISVFKEKGWDVTGIEFNKFAAEYASETFGVNIINKSIFDINETEKKEYDLVMLWGVLEHFYDPKKVLKKIHTLLKPGGILLLEVPSSDSLLVRFVENTSNFVDRIIEGDRHIMLFSLRAFKQMTGDCGFSAEKIVSNGLDIATIKRLYLRSEIEEGCVNPMQKILDESFQGDLLRGVFRKKGV